MKYRNILLTLFLVMIICLTVQSISAENITDDSCVNESEACFDEIDVGLDDSKEILSSYDEDSLSEISSDPIPTVETGTVSGGVDFTHVHPWAPSDAVNGNKGGITYNIPTVASNIKSAYIYVNVYSGSGGTAYGAYANTTITTANIEKQLGSEYLWTSTSSQNGVRYIVNDHIDRVYSDYMIFYNVTDLLQGLNGTSVSVDVVTYPMAGKSFDGRIKLVSLFVAWDDGDSDEIYYWLNAGQAWTDDTVNGLYHTFDNIPDIDFNEKLSTIRNVAASSTDAMYYINGMPFFSESESDEYLNGAYYQYHKWDVTQYMESGTLEVQYKPVGGAYGPSFKNIISILTIQDIPTYDEDIAEISFIPEFTEVPSAYAGTNNTLSIRITSKEGDYVVRLLADGKLVNYTECTFKDGANNLVLTDPTVRPVDELSVNGAENRKVNYTVQVLSKGKLLNSSSMVLPVLYNGYLGKDLAYPAGGIDYFLNITVNGDIVIDVQDNSHYISHNILNRTEVWNVNLDAGSNIVKSFIYIPYYEFNSKTYSEDVHMFNVTFNEVNVPAIGLYRDQSNLGRDYYSGYGVLVYDVTGLIRNGENVLRLNKKFDTPAVYPSALIYMYNTTGSDYIKEIYIYNGADLLEGISNNVAGRCVHIDTKMDVNSNLTSNATLYVFAGGPQPDEGNLIFNGEEHINIWNATMASNEVYSLDVTDSVKDSNYISFQATGFRIMALQQIMVLTKKLDSLGISLESEYPNTCYAGVNNVITINVQAVKKNKVIARLLVDGIQVNQTEIDLVYGNNQFTLADPTNRSVDEFTVIGAENKKVNYILELLSNGEVIANNTISLNILYNGYLAKDLAYPKGEIEPFLNITVNGGVVVDVKDASSYLTDFDIKRTDVWKVNLDNKSSVVRALVYVPYELCNINLISEDAGMFNVRFNGESVSPVALYRDQSNLGQYGAFGYGLVVYDVTGLLKDGSNSFELNKIKPTPKVYPSTLVYMYNTTGSAVVKNVYISNGVDLLSNDPNRLVQLDSRIDVDFIGDVAKLYVFAANAQDGEGDIVFNGESHENVWSGSESTTGLYVLDISDTVRKSSNDISFIVKSDTILALQQMIVTTQKVQSQINASNLTIIYSDKCSLNISLNEFEGISIGNAKVTVVFDGNSTILTTDDDGRIILPISSSLLPDVYDVSISYAGDENHIGSSANIKVTIEKMPTQISASNLTIPYNTNASLLINLSDVYGNAIPNTNLTVTFDGNSTVLATDKNGQITLSVPSGLLPKAYEILVSFESNETHMASSGRIILTVEKVPTQISAAGVTTVYNTDNSLIATLKDINGNAIVGAKVTFALNGAKKDVFTDAKGQAILAIPANLVPKTYAASITYSGDDVYLQSTAGVNVVVKKATVKLTAKNKSFKAKVKTKKYAVTLKDNKGKAMKKVKLTLKVKGKTYKATTNSKGKATFKIKKLTKKGKHKAKITYNGDKCFNKLVKSVKITVKK